MKTVYQFIFNFFDELTRPDNLYQYDDFHAVDNDEYTANLYTQNIIGIWSFWAVVRKNPLKIKK